MRAAAIAGDFQSFADGLPKSFGDKLGVFNLLRTRMGLKEMNNFRKHIELKTTNIRERYIAQEVFLVGDKFLNIKGEVHTVVERCTNYILGSDKTKYFLDKIVEMKDVEEALEDGTDKAAETYKKGTPGQLSEKQIKGLEKKSEESGIAYSILKTVFDRGMGAWKTSHRPGTTPQQWAFARVNSFISGGETQKTTDSDLWKKHKSKNESIEEVATWKSEGHYTIDGKEWTGDQHASDGQVMTGKTHTAASVNLYHFKQLPAEVRNRISASLNDKETSTSVTKESTILTKRFRDVVSEAKDCWDGYEKVPGVARGEQGSCVKKEEDEAVEEGVDDPAIFKAVFLAGGPGSGKSFTVGKTALTALGFKIVNSDEKFELLLKKADLEPSPENIYSPKGQEIRLKAKKLTGKQQDLYIAGRLGLVVDGTGKDYAKIKKQSDSLKSIGYDIAMIFVNTDLDTALLRNQKRSRSLPDAQVTTMWKEVQNNLGKFQSMFGSNFVIVDNSDGANIEKATTSAYKKMAKFASETPKNNIAKKWVAQQLGEV